MGHRDLVPVAGAGGGGGKGGGGSASSPVEAPDSLRSTQYARVINLICEGEVEEIVGGPQGIYVDDTPLANADGTWNFVGAGIEWRTGSATQAPITGFSATESETTVGVGVTTAAPVIRSVTNPNLNAVRVTLGFPALSNTDTKTGDVTGVTVQLAIDVQKDGGGFQQMYVDTIVGKTSSRYQRSYRISLARFGATGGTYDIRVRRLTPDSTTAYLVDAFQWETMTEIVDSNMTYPYSAIVGVQIDASTFRQIPKLSFDMKLRRIRIPANYDPIARTYSGNWDGTFQIAWTDNPAWILFDLATTARFGLGGYVTDQMIDKWTLYAISQYCDGLVPDGFGGWEPRYTCSVYFQTREDAITLLQQIAAIFNGMIFWAGGMLTVSADMPADPVMTYTAANVIDGSFIYTGTPLNQRHTVALVTWTNRANRCQQEIEYVEDRDAIERWGIREAAVVAIGCTSRGQAHRVGRWLLLTEQMLSETVAFKTGINAAFARPGDVFLTADETRAGYRTGGRLLAATVDRLKLDAPVTFNANASYTVGVLLPDGTLQRVALITPGNVTTDDIVLAENLRMEPERMGVWSISASNAVNEQWRCIGVNEDEDGNVEVQGVAYRPDKFGAIENDLKLERIPTGIIDPFSIGPCTELVVTESKYQINPVIVGARATFSWLAPLGAVRYAVAYQFESDSPVYVEAFMNSIDVQPTREGIWTFTVWAINSLGIRSVPATVTIELLALSQPPDDVSGFQLDIYNDAANLQWIQSASLDVIVGGQVVIRFSTRMSSEVSWEEASEITRFSGGMTNGFVPLMKGSYFAKFMNSSEKYSQNAALVISTTGPLRDYNLVEDMKQNPAFAGEKVYTEVRTGVLYLSQDEHGFAISTTGEYYFDHVIDLGNVYTVRCTSYVEGAAYDFFNDVDTWPDWDEVLDVDGTKIDEGGAMVLASLTNVDPTTGADEDWSPYVRLVAADLTFRAARFQCVLHVKDDTQGIGITDLGVTVDVPDRMESRNNVTIAVGGSVITFSVPFKDAPAIAIIAQGLQTGDKWLIDQQSANGFRIQFQTSDGSPVAKTCDWIARGYGYEHIGLAHLGYAALMRFDTPAVISMRERIGPKLQKASTP
ncbi:putative phage tail protein [Paraburkholderia sp. CI2]|uniref:host specificity protein J n=1 Tax=Paraburkholderia sp. CI2 TaxID=2723093 RepID=UPI0016171320|nr:phage tail protein [Paraburkholderia sp. CI2]MBB5469379.1 putative phage tail protein [Paraburkholderia sp. CI2]